MTAEHAAAARSTHAHLAAEIVHTLACTRCRMGWTCGGLGEDDYEAGERIVRLLDTRATAADTVLAEARRLCCGDNPAPHHAATHDHSTRMAFAEELARAVRHA